jgi:hypothetical protein
VRNTLLGCHFLFAGLWLGCVVTEALFERALLAGDRPSHLRLAALHVRVDKAVELPAIFGVLLTGAALFLYGHPSGPAFYLTASAGAIAIVANLYCVWLVFRRHNAATSENWALSDQLDHLQHKVGAVVLIGLLFCPGRRNLGARSCLTASSRG